MADVDFCAERTAIEGLRRITMRQATDGRGTVRELYRSSAFAEHGLGDHRPWVQVNVTESRQGAVRGLHGERTSKLVAIVHGEAFGAYVDVRPDSPTVGNLVTFPLRPGTAVLVPAGVCNGFQSVSPGVTHYLYCFDAEWAPDRPGIAITPLDEGLAIPWPLPVDPTDRTQLSEKDAGLPTLRQVLDGTA